jgi:hypothetical protein
VTQQTPRFIWSLWSLAIPMLVLAGCTTGLSDRTSVNWGMVATVASAIFTAVSALGAFYAAWATKKAAQAQVLLDLLRHYSSVDMSDALRTLRAWHRDHGDAFASHWWNRFKEQYPGAVEVDRARRMVTSYFQDADSLWRADLISEKTLRVAVDKAGFAVLIHVCSPLERELNPNVDLDFIERLEKLVPEPRRELLAAIPKRSRFPNQ